MKIYIFSLFVLIVTGCNRSTFTDIKGASSRGKWVELTPRGMSFIHQGSFNIGPNDQETSNLFTPTKTVTVAAFWIDDTEITNNEYRQFIYWVRDSIARKMIGEQFPEFAITEDSQGNPISEPRINWREKINWDNTDYQLAMQDIYVPEYEKFYGIKEVDPRKLNYEYWWIDLRQAARRANMYNNETQRYTGSVYDQNGNLIPVENRSSFMFYEKENIFPDTLCWIRDFTYSYNDPMARNYFWHPAFDDYPVVGVTWKQATAFCHWRSKQYNDYLSERGLTIVDNYRLPSEAEWEYAARGGRQSSLFPWGGYYTRGQTGNFMANFKPLRGNYVEDGGIQTLKVGNYQANDYGLYDMSGNVAEWTSNAYAEAAYDVIHDLNPDYQYNARPDDPPVMKRKVIRGGSWKDIEEYQQASARSYEYQDTAKSYIGFRCVRSTFCDVFEGPSARK
jgi:formylglycine-generating enzyme